MQEVEEGSEAHGRAVRFIDLLNSLPRRTILLNPTMYPKGMNSRALTEWAVGRDGFLRAHAGKGKRSEQLGQDSDPEVYLM